MRVTTVDRRRKTEGNVGFPAQFSVWKTTGNDSSEACATACQNCGVYSVFPSGMTSHSKIAQFNWVCIGPVITEDKNKRNLGRLSHILKQVLWFIWGHGVQQLVEVLRYKSEGCGFNSRRCQWNFSFTKSFLLHYGTWGDSASNRTEYQEYFLGGKGSWYIGLPTLPPSCTDCIEIWEPQTPGKLTACPGLQWDCFTCYN